MGWRYRKSINLGGGFRINLSKSGIGYSWGFKGYRVTHTANGQKKKTYSIPGTGLSYTETVSRKRRKRYRQNTYRAPRHQQSQPKQTTHTETGNVSRLYSENLDQISADDLVVNAIGKVKKLNRIANILCITLILLPIGLAMKLYLHVIDRVSLDYSFDDFATEKNNLLISIVEELRKNNKLWRITAIRNNTDLRATSGAKTSIIRNPVTVNSNKLPWFVKTNIDVPCIIDGYEMIHLLPDRALIIDHDRVYACKYGSMHFVTGPSNYIEEDTVPSDATIVGQTWKHMNMDGSPDRRYKDNRRLPICQYGLLQVNSDEGVNFALETSSVESMTKINSLLKSFVDLVNKESESEKTYIDTDGNPIEDSPVEATPNEEIPKPQFIVSLIFRIIFLVIECVIGLGGFFASIDGKTYFGCVIWVAYVFLGFVANHFFYTTEYKKYRLIVLAAFIIGMIYMMATIS